MNRRSSDALILFSGEILMTNAPVNTNTPQSTATPQNASGSQTPAQKISAKEIHVKWDKISEVEASGMKVAGDLIAQVQAKYSMNPEQAARDVTAWTNGRTF
jgi:hypothetical protein